MSSIPASIIEFMTKVIIGLPDNLCNALGRLDFILVPAPAASIIPLKSDMLIAKYDEVRHVG